MYGPLSHSDTVNGGCTVSELASVNVENSAEQVDSSSQLCEFAAVNVTHSSAVTLQPSAEVIVTSVQLSSVSESDAQPAVGNPSVSLKQSELTSDDSYQPADVARDWSAGVLVTNCSGKAVEVIVTLFLVSLFTFTLMLLS